MKTCSKCGQQKPLSEFYWHKQRGRYMNPCKRCRIERQRERGKDPKVAAQRADYQRQYYGENREADLARSKAWADANREQSHRIKARWRETHPAHQRMTRSRRRARDAGATVVEEIWADDIYARDEGRCGICHEPVSPHQFDIDHVVPVARGGQHTHHNVQLAHGTCNKRKGTSIS